MDVAVIRTGVGNTASVLYALERLCVRAVLTDDPRCVAEAPRAILPGVGAAAPVMARLKALGLDAALRVFDRPLLGICLGQQLLFERSEEGDAEGLGFFGGAVAMLPGARRFPVPHMGWSPLYIDQPHALTDGLRAGDYVYFVHSYACPILRQTLAVTSYGRAFSAMVGDDNVFGCQFHPERSGKVGARILQNFMDLPC